MKCELICADIDGTLLDDSKKILSDVRKSLRYAADKGIKIALISGRMPAGVIMVENELGISCIKACNAGTYIIADNECISADYIAIESMESVYENIAEKYRIPLWIFKDNEWFVTAVDGYVEREAEIIGQTPEITDIGNLMDEWKKDGAGPNKLLFAAEPEKIEVIRKNLQEYPELHIAMARSLDTYLEIFPEGANKGKAVLTICKEFGIDRQNIIAIGDHELDIPMIEVAGIGIAVGNAVKVLKEKADFVTKTNNEAGVAWALRQYLAEQEEDKLW